MSYRAGIAALLLGFVAQASWCAVKTRSDKSAGSMHRVCIIPATAQMVRVGAKGGEQMTKESEEWAAKLNAAVAHAVTLAGGEITGDLSIEALKNDEDARQAVVRVDQKYQSVSVQLRKKPKEVAKRRYSLGDEIALLPCARQADSIAFIRATAMIQTAGRKTIMILAGGVGGAFLSLSRYDISIAFADAKTGNITAFLSVDERGGKTGENPDDALRVMLVQNLKTLPIQSAGPPQRQSD